MGWFRRERGAEARDEKDEDGAEARGETEKDAGKGSQIEPPAPDPAPHVDVESAPEGREPPASGSEEAPAEAAEADPGPSEALGRHLASVKKEYDAAVSRLIDVKKELATKRRESAAANAACTELQRRANALEAGLKKSEILEGKMRAGVREREAALKELERTNAALEEHQGRLKSVRDQIESAASELEAVQKKTAGERARLDEYTALLQKTRTMIKESNKSAPRRAPGGDVIRTASLMVASLNDKLAAAEKEIGVLRGILDQERRAHAQTRTRLAAGGDRPGA